LLKGSSEEREAVTQFCCPFDLFQPGSMLLQRGLFHNWHFPASRLTNDHSSRCHHWVCVCDTILNDSFFAGISSHIIYKPAEFGPCILE
jgi:hypothetical protein